MSEPTDHAARVEALLAQLTLDEKLHLIAGVDGFDVPGAPRLGIPRLGTADSPFGVRAIGPATLYVGGIALAATWNPVLAHGIGEEIGRDARARGKHYSLGPGVNVYRSPRCGRNFEYFGEDPCLGARLAVAWIEGLQAQGVSATVKHWVGNQSEHLRHLTDSRIDVRTLREIYLPIFEAAVKEARTGAVMAAYNLVNGAYMTAHCALNLDLLKGEWGFPGVLMSDWGAVHDAEGAANGGTDLEMPGPQHFHPRALRELLASGRLAEATIDDKVRRLVGNVLRFGWDARPAADADIPRDCPQARAAALEGAREAIVLLKNDGALLPLDARARIIAVIGPNARHAVPVGGGSAVVPTAHAVSFLDGISARLGGAGEVLHARGIPDIETIVSRTAFATRADGEESGLVYEEYDRHELAGDPIARRVVPDIRSGRAFSLAELATGAPVDVSALAGDPNARLGARWTGWYTADEAGTHDVVVQLGGFMEAGWRLRVDGRLVADRWARNDAVLEGVAVELDAGPHELVLEYRTVPGLGSPYLRAGIVRRGAWVDDEAVALAARADVVVLAVGFDALSETENWDRTFALPPGQDELIARVVAANPHVVVALTAGGGVDMAPWIDRVPALLHTWYLGEAGGTALAEVLFGDVNPSGRLPITLERRAEDAPAFAHYHPVAGSRRVEYREGVFVGYRGFERSGTAPLFPFGYGLSYTSFRFDALEIALEGDGTEASARWSVSFDVTNVGARAGATVAQLYVADRTASVERPPKELRAFAKVALDAGETRRVRLELDARALAFFDVAEHRWLAEAGEFDVLVGASSADLPLRGTLRLVRDVTIPLA